MANINNLIANSQNYTARPVTNYLAGQRNAQQRQMNNLQMQNTNQTMQNRQQAMQRDANNEKMKIIATYMKGATQNDYHERANALYRTHGYKTPTRWDASTKRDIDSIVELSGMTDEPIQKFKDIGNGLQRNTTTNEIGSYRTPETLKAPVKRTMPSGVNEHGQNMVIDRLYEGNSIIEQSDPYIKKEITRESDVDAADYGELSKAGNTKLDKAMIDQSAYRDNINILSKQYSDFKSGGYSKNKLTSWASSLGNMLESVGADLPEGWKEQNQSYDQLMTGAGRLLDAYRKVVTGSQASAIELQKFLLNRVPNEGDAESRFEAKMAAVIDFDDISKVRLNQLKKNGWKLSGVSGEGDDISPMYSKDGRVSSIDQISSLDSIPLYQDRRNQIMTRLANGRSRSEIPKKARQQMAVKATRLLKEEGYNTGLNR